MNKPARKPMMFMRALGEIVQDGDTLLDSDEMLYVRSDGFWMPVRGFTDEAMRVLLERQRRAAAMISEAIEESWRRANNKIELGDRLEKVAAGIAIERHNIEFVREKIRDLINHPGWSDDAEEIRDENLRAEYRAALAERRAEFAREERA